MNCLGFGRFLAIAVVVSGSVARAQSAGEVYQDFENARELGMGGAAVATVDDESALFLNPAGLGRIRSTYLSFNAEAESNYQTQAAYTNNSGTDWSDPQSLLNFAKQNSNQHLHVRVQTVPSFVTTNFGMAAFGTGTVDAEYSPDTNNMLLHYRSDMGAIVGYDLRLLEGRLKIGVAGKIIDRAEINKYEPGNQISGSATNLTMGSLVAEGTGVGLNAGALLTAPWAWLPTLGVTVQDVGNTYFNVGNGFIYNTGVTPPPQMQTTNVAFALFPIHSNHTRSAITGELQDIQNLNNDAIIRNVHAGYELDLGDILYLRAGMNQGYYTAGFEFDFGNSAIQFATYGEEIGVYPTTREDRRFVLQYEFRL